MPQRAQFSLRTLMALMLWVSLTSAAFSVFGAGAMIAGIAAGLLAFNAAGALEMFQHGRLGVGLVIMAWSVFAVSFFVPAAVPYGSVFGWEAAWLVAESVLEFPDSLSTLIDYSFSVCVTLANLMMALSPIGLWVERTRAGVWFAALFCVMAAAALVCCFSDVEGLAIGYYLWNSSFLMMLSATRIGWLIASVSIGTMALWITIDVMVY